MNFLDSKLSMTPIKKRAKILTIFLSLAGFLEVVARGMAIPMMKRNDGKIRSAGVRPFH